MTISRSSIRTGLHSSKTGLTLSSGLVFAALLACLLGGPLGCRMSRPAFGSSPVPSAGESDIATLRPGLVISVSVLVAGKTEINEPAKRISDRGTIMLPLLGTLNVQDATPDTISTRLTSAYAKYYVDPQVIVEYSRDNDADEASPWGYVTVLGRVKNPGRFAIPATRDLTVSGAIQKAGGLDTSAKSGAIIVTRRNARGEPETRKIDMDAVGAGAKLDDDIIVIADDVVFIPERRF